MGWPIIYLANQPNSAFSLPAVNLPRGVMVAREILDLFVKVRVLARQPTYAVVIIFAAFPLFQLGEC
ncbi:MAG: hypothetical protein JWO45_1535 [Spartobacteria bacterium]|nr:hypothetical protein [Spartobacteria bacterium]